MLSIAHALTTAVVVLGIVVLLLGRLPILRMEFRRSLALAVAAVALLVLLLSLNVMNAAVGLRAEADSARIATANGLLLTGLMLLLVGALSFLVCIGVAVWVHVEPMEGPPRPPEPESRAAEQRIYP